jgi:hypothetical protein
MRTIIKKEVGNITIHGYQSLGTLIYHVNITKNNHCSHLNEWDISHVEIKKLKKAKKAIEDYIKTYVIDLSLTLRDEDPISDDYAVKLTMSHMMMS